jgi:thiol:disulfide interchange protein DsbC
VVAAPAAAGDAQPVAADAASQALLARLRAQQPRTRIDSVQPSAVPGLFEVVMGRNVAYVEPTGRFAIFGNVWDLEQGRDLTVQRRAALERVDAGAFPLGDAVRTVRGDGSRVLHVMADPRCGYCKQLEHTLASLTNTTVYTHLLPVLGDESKSLAADIWCAADRSQAWDAWMLRGQKPATATAECSDRYALVAERVQRVAGSFGIQATPSLIAADGRKHAGAMPIEQLEAWMSATATTKADASADEGRPKQGGQVVTLKTTTKGASK